MLPEIFTGRKICIICEGSEEYEYLSRLIALDVWNKKYRFLFSSASKGEHVRLKTDRLSALVRRTYPQES